MPYVLAAVLVIVVAGLAAAVWWWKNRAAAAQQPSDGEQERPLLSFVALLREHRHVEPIMIATAARKALGADLLSEAEEEGADGFVAERRSLRSSSSVSRLRRPGGAHRRINREVVDS